MTGFELYFWFKDRSDLKAILFLSSLFIIASCHTPIDQFEINDRGEYLGVSSCIECHQQEYDEWFGSHHERSMTIASESTVKGDFNEYVFTSNGVTSRFYRDEGKFYVHTEGPGGTYGDFEIKYTFGEYPLQQYMVEFPGGKIQCLLQAWDSENKKWFDLSTDGKVDPDDWMHWTKGSMTWNTMCADCHSTNLKKNYDEESRTYNTSYDIINVSCESCHGPGESHVAYVNSDAYQLGQRIDGSLMYQAVAQDKKALIDECARCHSRRGSVTEYFDHTGVFMDHYLPSIIAPALYHTDGQILEEVYVYGSFLQSKMYDRNVSCIDCHNPHNLELKFEGNKLCTQCHKPEDYDLPAHHFHEQDSDGAKCISCHMPGKVYMGNDFRRDHSFRVPRPDLSEKFGTPNACNDCHSDKSYKWADQAVREWYGDERIPHFSELLAAAHDGDISSLPGLMSMVGDTSIPDIIQASAVQVLGNVNLNEASQKIIEALEHENAFVRHAAVSALSNYTKESRLSLLPVLLSDPVRIVRIQTAYALGDVDLNELDVVFHQDFQEANDELLTSFSVQADFPGGQLVKGQYYQKKGQLTIAEEAYQEAIRIDQHLVQPYLNLANIKYLQGDFETAMRLFNKCIELDSLYSEAFYSIGLLQAEMKNIEDAEYALRQAAVISGNPLYYYNWGLTLQKLGRPKEAEKAFLKALEAEKESESYLYALSILYIQQDQKMKALRYIRKLMEIDPANLDYKRLFNIVNN